MARKITENTSTISTDLTNDLHFLVLEIKQLFDKVKSVIVTVDPTELPSLKNHEAIIENLKNRIESVSYEAIYRLKDKNKSLILNYRALIRVASNLQKIADFLVQAANQIIYIKDTEQFKFYNLSEFYEVVDVQLESVHLAFTEVDKTIAEKMYTAEKKLDELYLERFNFIQNKISKKKNTADMITLLFIIRYFERIGDKFLKIGESVLNVSVGEAVNIKHYQKLEQVVDALAGSGLDVRYDFKPFLFSRSGCKVGRLSIETQKDYQTQSNKYFYKQGDHRKIKEEVDGLDLWHKKFPSIAPEVVWKVIDKENSTLVVHYIKGENFLNYVLKTSDEEAVFTAAKQIEATLKAIWSKNKVKAKGGSQFIQQIIKRKSAIENVHEDFFDEFRSPKKKKENFKQLLTEAKGFEKKVKVPFHVLCHGDFNLDNIIYDPENEAVRFVDVHRTGFNDYAQEISVFIVSALRIRIEDEEVRNRLNLVCLEMYAFGKKFAKKHNDVYFEARLCLGLFRSFVTSTRFLNDEDWYNRMRTDAIYVINTLRHHKNDLKKVTINLKNILN